MRILSGPSSLPEPEGREEVLAYLFSRHSTEEVMKAFLRAVPPSHLALIAEKLGESLSVNQFDMQSWERGDE